MKRINFVILVIIVSALCSKIFADDIELKNNENKSITITDLQFENEKDAKKFYLADENGKTGYGFFEDEKYDFNKMLIDKSLNIYNGRVKSYMLQMFYNSFIKYRNNIAGAALGFSFAGLMIPGSACLLAFGIQREVNDLSKQLLISNGAIWLVCGGFEFIIGIVACALTGYHYKNTKSLKERIINNLNGNKTSLIKNDYFNVNFTLNVNFAHY